MRALLELLKRPAPPKCAQCGGTGLVTVCRGWHATMCWCGACDGTGRAQGAGDTGEQADGGAADAQ